MNWCKNPTFKEVGFWFGTNQILKWRVGDVAYTGRFQPTHMPLLLPHQAPLPPQTTTTMFHPWQIRTVSPPQIRTKKRSWTIWNDAYRTQMDGNGWYTPPPIPWRGYFWTWSIRSVGTPPELHNTQGEKSMGRSYIWDTVSLVRLFWEVQQTSPNGLVEPSWTRNKSPLVLSRTIKTNGLGNFTTNCHLNIILIR